MMPAEQNDVIKGEAVNIWSYDSMVRKQITLRYTYGTYDKGS